jgi:ABC-2 type transport system ATP-binding protein
VLEEQAIAVAAVTVARPTLDDVYLRYTGRTFRAAEQASDEERAA